MLACDGGKTESGLKRNEIMFKKNNHRIWDGYFGFSFIGFIGILGRVFLLRPIFKDVRGNPWKWRWRAICIFLFFIIPAFHISYQQFQSSKILDGLRWFLLPTPPPPYLHIYRFAFILSQDFLKMYDIGSTRSTRGV